MQDAWLKAKASEEEEGIYDDDESNDLHLYNLDYHFGDYTVVQREEREYRQCNAIKFFEDGKNIADRCFFRGLASKFDLEKISEIYIIKILNSC